MIVGLIVGSFYIGQTLVDIFVILAALFSLLAFAALAFAAVQVVGLVKEMRGEVTTVVGAAQETLGEARGTVGFLGDSMISPVAQAAGWVSATRAAVKSFTEPLYKRRD